MAAQVRAGDRLLRRRLGLSRAGAAPVGRPRRTGLRHARHAARVDCDVAAGGGDSGRIRGRHAADDRRSGRSLRHPPAWRRAARGGAGGRRHRLFPGRGSAPPCGGDPQHLVSGGKGLAYRRTRTGQAQFGRGAPPGRKRQSGEVPLPGDDEPRTAHPAQRHPRLLRGDAGGTVRSTWRARLQGIFERHSRRAASIS